MLPLVSFMLSIISLTSSTTFFYPEDPPAYCSSDMARYTIPPLSPADKELVKGLVQVQLIIRHGARTPYGYYTCWNGYNPEWNDCNVTELVSSSSSYDNSGGYRKRPIYKKLYDGSPNILFGNCQTGQLISDGYRQTTELGNMLRERYIGSDNPSSGNFGLFENSSWDSLKASQTYFRSDDMERTLLSGQNLVSAMFSHDSSEEGVNIDWHTGDYLLDQISPNNVVCPGLESVESEAYQSQGFLEFNGSLRATELNERLDLVLGAGVWSWSNLLDCLMTTLCGSTRPSTLPATMTDDLLESIVRQIEASFAYLLTYRDWAWSKMGIGNLAWRIRTGILDAIEGSTGNPETTTNRDGSGIDGLGPYKLVLYAAHDTTIMPFLAAILKENWDGKWAAYASIVAIEIYDSKSAAADHYFRIVYNGREQVLPACSSGSGSRSSSSSRPSSASSLLSSSSQPSTSLCNIKELLDALSFGQPSMPNCNATNDVSSLPASPSFSPISSLSHSPSASTTGDVRGQEEVLDPQGPKALVLSIDLLVVISLAVFFGALIGASAVRFRFSPKYHRIHDAVDEPISQSSL